MRVVQLLPTLVYGDAVGNDTLAIHRFLTERGFESDIYAENIGARVRPLVKSFTAMPELHADDVLIYHLSTNASEEMYDVLQRAICRKVAIYHNITPGRYFAQYDEAFAKFLDDGRAYAASRLRDMFSCCWAVSSYNGEDLRAMGFSCPIYVLPILIPLDDYDILPASGPMLRYKNDARKNILFVGRIAPNKKIEDVIRVFDFYMKHIDAGSRLFIVGHERGDDPYMESLRTLVDELSLRRDVVFVGHVPFEHIIAYYKLADLFLCMSDHEGFCVPLVEAMKFDIPIVAYSAAAVPDTLGGAGLVATSRTPGEAAALMREALTDVAVRQRLSAAAAARLEDFSTGRIEERLEKLLDMVMTGKYAESEITSPPAKVCDAPPPSLAENTREDREDQVKKSPAPPPEVVDTLPQKPGGTTSVKRTPPTPPPAKPVPTEKLTPFGWAKRKILKPVYLSLRDLAPGIADRVRLSIYDAYFSINPPKPSMIYVDVTQTVRMDIGTGIQRVVNEVFRAMGSIQGDITAVRNERSTLLSANQYMEKSGMTRPGKDQKINTSPGDILFLLDSSWEYHRDFERILNSSWRLVTYSVIYDMIPVQYPDVVISDLLKKFFTGWHDMVLQKAQGVLCISRSVADVVADYYAKKKFKRKKPLELHYFHMGARMPSAPSDPRPELRSFLTRRPTFLMVGTVEPRKGHGMVLDMMERAGTRLGIQLLIIGHDGWNNDEVKKRIAGASLRENVMWISDADDGELSFAYQSATALIAASRDEGFGLPLIEAAYFGLPILASDIPVFREVTAGHATFFTVMDSHSLESAIDEWIGAPSHPNSRDIPIYTWEDSAREILKIITGNQKPYKVLK